MPEYIPKARSFEGLASQVLDTRAQRVNPLETLAEQIGNVGGAYYKAKKEKKDTEKKNKMDLTKQSYNDLTEDKSMWSDEVVSGKVDIDKIPLEDHYKYIKPNPEYIKSKKQSSVSPDNTPLTESVRRNVNKALRTAGLAEVPEGTTVGQLRAQNPYVTTEAGMTKFSKDQRDEDLTRLENKRKEYAGMTVISAELKPGEAERKVQLEKDIAELEKKLGLPASKQPTSGEQKSPAAQSVLPQGEAAVAKPSEPKGAEPVKANSVLVNNFIRSLKVLNTETESRAKDAWTKAGVPLEVQNANIEEIKAILNASKPAK